MADDSDDAAAGGSADDQSNLDDAQGGKNTDLRRRASANDLARDERQNRPAMQSLMARSRRGRDMTEGATEESKQVGGFVKRFPDAANARSAKWYDGK